MPLFALMVHVLVFLSYLRNETKRKDSRTFPIEEPLDPEPSIRGGDSSLGTAIYLLRHQPKLLL